MRTLSKPIPVIDLFAGPGGLCEGFSSLKGGDGQRLFSVKISIEKDPVAHRTLWLRALFRTFPKGKAPQIYYDYVRGYIGRDEFLAHPAIAQAAEVADTEAKCAELGVDPHEKIDRWIKDALGGDSNWVLIGGPPCQAYSMAGRSRLRGKDPGAFESDKRHFLYQEYLRIIQRFQPAVFVMENVKGMLTSTHGGSYIFHRILADLSTPKPGLKYEIRSLVVDKDGLEPQDFVIEADDYGVPQSRHRVILFGIRSDLAAANRTLAEKPESFLLKKQGRKIGVNSALEGLPHLRSRLSREPDSHAAWLVALREASRMLSGMPRQLRVVMDAAMERAREVAVYNDSPGAAFIQYAPASLATMPAELRSWYLDPKLGGVIQHESRSHMRSDLHRYLYAACYAQAVGNSPKLKDFPTKLLPNHGNVDSDSTPFVDRFRVQVGDLPSSTVVAHISKDGHYYIHPDPSQCRSLTLREAARLQTFPDNYFFEGNRTQQYVQVGNAVPPLLAKKISEVIFKFMSSQPS